MLLIRRDEVMNLDNAMRGARNPMNSWDKSDSRWSHPSPFALYDYTAPKSKYVLGPNDIDLAKRLVKAGPDHRKFLRQIFVCVDVTAPIYWWKEYDTYKVATVANSTSTMHKIHSKEFSMNDFSVDHMTPDTYAFMENVVVPKMEEIRLRYMNNGKNKDDWYDMIQLLPSSYNQMRTLTFNYETLTNIYKARRNHKLQEWHVFCDWIESLPYAAILITGEGLLEQEDV